MKSSRRVLIIGLDGATWDILDPWIQDGTLPYLAHLRQVGVWGPLFSSIPPLSAPAWSTFMTGKRPGKHGVFHFIELFSGKETSDDHPVMVNARSIQSATLWDILAHHGRKVGLVNLPMTYPPRQVNGFMITGLLTPKNAKIFTYPPELSNELRGYVIEPERFSGRRPFQDSQLYDPEITTPTLAMMQEFREVLEKRAQVTLSLIESQPWDMFMVVFTETDRMGHYLWPFHRTAAPSDVLHRAIRDYYIRLDEIIRDLVTQAGKETVVIVMSDHGMGPVYTRRAHWNSWLAERGWLTIAGGDSLVSRSDTWLRRLRLPRDRIGRILRRVPGLYRTRMIQKVAAAPSGVVDTERSRAYCVRIYHYTFGVRINAANPEERDALREEIIRAMRDVVDPQTGRRIVQHIYRGEEYYHGPHANHIPEIIVVMAPEYTLGERVGHYSSIATELQAQSAQGDHTMEGVFIAAGPGIASGAMPLTELKIEDIAPTVLHIMGLPVASDMDGRVLTEIFAADDANLRPVELEEPRGLWPRADAGVWIEEAITAEDQAQIEERLRGLGYLD